MDKQIEWIAVDWGTSRLRAWAMQGHSVVADAVSDRGMTRVDGSGFEAALLDLVEPWLGSGPIDVVACGMVGARQGWVEAPYTAVPSKPLQAAPVRVPGTDTRIRAYVVGGLKQNEPADVMRGEETQIAGFLARNAGWDGVICLPGTHTKWAHVSAGEVVSFRSFMTGELFELLSTKSVLRHSVSDGWDDEAFDETVQEAMARPEALAARLFGLRANDLLNAVPPSVARARLSGTLIGAELAAARPYWLGQALAIIGNSGMSRNYARALELQAAWATVHSADDAVRRGLAVARERVEGAG